MDGPNAFEMNGSGVPDPPPQSRVPDLERIRNARNKRKLQLKEWHQYDRKMTREAEKLQRKGLSPPSERGFHRTGHAVKFPPSLIFLEAAARGDLDEVRKLLSNGVCPDVANEDGLTALHQQVYRFTAEEAAELKKLQARGANGCCIDNTPEMCQLLLRFGANPNARDSEGWTPLHAAATCHHTDLCAILIANGADLLAMNTDGNMPYECCMPGPTLNLIETEMDRRGITQEELDDLHRLPECKMLADMEAMYKAGADFNALDQQGAAMLHIAAACGFEEVTIFLLKHGAKIDLLDREGWQAIHIAACWDHLEIIEVLVNFGADIMATTSAGETVFDICEDVEMHTRLIELKQELERKQSQQRDSLSRTERPRELVRRRSSTNPRSASIRRTSMREKKMISWKEAKQEAEMRGLTPLDVPEGETPEPDTDHPKQRQQQESIKSTPDVNFERRVTSPLTVGVAGDKIKLDSTSPATRSSSPPGLPSPGSVSSPKPKRITSVTSPPPPGRLVNGVTSPIPGRPPSRAQDRNSGRPPRPDKKSGDQLPDVAKRTSEREYGSLKGPSTTTNHVIAVSPPRSAQRPYMTMDLQSAGSVSPVSRIRPHPPSERIVSLPATNGGSGNGGGRTQDMNIITPSPQIARRSANTMGRKKTPDSIVVKPDLNLSVHNAYIMPPPSTPHPLTSDRTKTGSLPRSTQLNRHASGHQSARLQSRKPTKELIAYDSDMRNSGKCCVLM